MNFQQLLIRQVEQVAVVTLNRPESRNAFSLTMREELAAFFEAMRFDHTVNVIVVTGAGKAFCAGGDITGMTAHASALDFKDFVRNKIHRVVHAITGLEKPVIAMVNGAATGAGCCLALMCDLVIASDQAKLGMAFVRVGLGPDWGGAYFLPRLIGPARAKELLFTGRLIKAAEAERMGLVNQVVAGPSLEETVMTLAGELARGPVKAMGTAKMLVNRGMDMDLTGLLEYEASMAALLSLSEDHREGVQAFLQKRTPEFKGR